MSSSVDIQNCTTTTGSSTNGTGTTLGLCTQAPTGSHHSGYNQASITHQANPTVGQHQVCYDTNGVSVAPSPPYQQIPNANPYPHQPNSYSSFVPQQQQQ